MKPREAMSAHLGCESLKELEAEHRYQPRPNELHKRYTSGDYIYTYGERPPSTEWDQDPDQFYARQAKTIIWRKRVS